MDKEDFRERFEFIGDASGAKANCKAASKRLFEFGEIQVSSVTIQDVLFPKLLFNRQIRVLRLLFAAITFLLWLSMSYPLYAANESFQNGKNSLDSKPASHYYFDDYAISLQKDDHINLMPSVIIFLETGRSDIDFFEGEYSDTLSSVKEFQTECNEILAYYRNKLLFKGQGLILDDYFSMPSFFIDRAVEDISNDSKRYFVTFDLVINIGPGHLNFTYVNMIELTSDNSKLNLDKFKKNEQTFFLKSVKSFLSRYEWVGEEQIFKANHFRTPFGLIDLKDNYPVPSYSLLAAAPFAVPPYMHFIHLDTKRRVGGPQKTFSSYNGLNEQKSIDRSMLNFRSFAGRIGLEVILISTDAQDEPLIRFIWSDLSNLFESKRKPLNISFLAKAIKNESNGKLQIDPLAHKLWNDLFDGAESISKADNGLQLTDRQ